MVPLRSLVALANVAADGYLVVTSAVAALFRNERAFRRPRWSQQFLADELCRLGYDATRERIARLEVARPLEYNAELILTVATALRISERALFDAIWLDYQTIAASLHERLERSNELVVSRVPRPVSPSQFRRLALEA